MSSAAGAGPNHPSTRQPTGSHETPGESALGYGDIDTETPTAEQPGTGVRSGAAIQHVNELDYVDDENPQPLDPSLIAGGENLVGAANHVATGIDSVDANFGDDEDALVRIDREGHEQAG